MAIKLSSIKNKIAEEISGSYIDIPDWPGVKLGVRSLEFPAYKLAVDNLLQIYERKYKGGKAPPAVRDIDFGRLLATHILFDWSGFEEEYSDSQAMELLTSPEGRDFGNQTVWAARQVARTDVEFVEAATKNSVKPSGTN
jgi:hypothetical protein